MALSRSGDAGGKPRAHGTRLASTDDKGSLSIPASDRIPASRVPTGTTSSGRWAGHQLVLHSEKSACHGKAMCMVRPPGAVAGLIRHRPAQVLASREKYVISMPG